MNSHFFQYPIRVAKLMQAPARTGPSIPTADEHPTCSLGTSIAQFLHLLLHTRPGQLRSAADFGCTIWEVEFDNNLALSHWEETLKRSLLAAVRQHEPRLRDVSIRVSISLVVPAGAHVAQSAARWQAHISIKGIVRFTHEAFNYSTQLQVGQLVA